MATGPSLTHLQGEYDDDHDVPRQDDEPRDVGHVPRGPSLSVDRAARPREPGRREHSSHTRVERASPPGYSRVRYTRTGSAGHGSGSGSGGGDRAEWVGLSAAQLVLASELSARVRDNLSRSPPPPYGGGGASGLASSDPPPGSIEPDGISPRSALLPRGNQVSYVLKFPGPQCSCFNL